MVTSRHKRRTVPYVVPFLASMTILVAALSYTRGQASDLTTLSYQAFADVAKVYQAGGEAPDLVTRLDMYVLDSFDLSGAGRF